MIKASLMALGVVFGAALLPGLAQAQVEASLYSGNLIYERGNKLYFFSGDSYVRWDVVKDSMDPGYPQSITRSLPGVPADLDAATYSGDVADGPRAGKAYFFKGGSYWRWDLLQGRMEKGYPKLIREQWPGIPDNLDAVVNGGDNSKYGPGKLYFFKGDRYWRWDIRADRLDPGYPQLIRSSWPGIPDNLDSAVFAGYSKFSDGNRLYFFKGNRYWRWDIENDRMDPGYPKDLSAGWPGVDRMGR